MVEREEELKSLLMRVNNLALKFSIQETIIMASSPITLWQLEGEKVETVTDFTFLGSRITAEGDCAMKLKYTSLLAVLSLHRYVGFSLQWLLLLEEKL